MIQDKTLSAEKGCSLVKDGDAVLNHLASSLWASREGVVRGVASGRLLLVHLLVRTRHCRRGAPCGQPLPDSLNLSILS